MLKDKIVFITGASAGIGKASAELFAEAGCKLILLARRKRLLDNLVKKLSQQFKSEIYSVVCDIRNRSDLNAAIVGLPSEFWNIDILINNAGLARGFDKIQEGRVDDWDEMIDTNVKGLLYITRLILPGMVERNSGHIINIASIAGTQVYPGGNIYCATKAAVKMLSEAMIMDLNGTNIRVTNIDPGLVETEFAYVRRNWDIEKAKPVYEGYKPLTGRDIAEVALFAASRPARVCIQNIMVTPLAQATTMVVHKTINN